MKCPYCDGLCREIDAFGGILNHRRHKIHICYECMDCGQIHERDSRGTIIRQDGRREVVF